MEYASSAGGVSAGAGGGAPMLVIADGGAAEAWRQAAALAGGQVGEVIGWDAAQGVAPGARQVLLVEAIGIEEATLLRVLPVLGALVQEGGVQVAAAIAPGQIDPVAAALLGGDVQLLVEPSPSDRVVALAIATERWAAVGTPETRENDAERLERLNAEVARIADVLARLTRSETAAAPRPDGLADRRRGFGAEPAGEVAIEASDVRRVIRARRLREQFFGAGLFEDPAWDMLLDLLAAELERTRVSVSSLCIAAAVAPTTALRWITKMTEAGLLVRAPDPQDKRRAYMALSERSRSAMRLYLEALRRQGLAMV